jgi:hypothetical protein
MSGQKMMFQIVFLAIGVMFSMFAFIFTLKVTDNPIIALLSMVAILAFWIGTLSVVFRVRF